MGAILSESFECAVEDIAHFTGDGVTGFIEPGGNPPARRGALSPWRQLWPASETGARPTEHLHEQLKVCRGACERANDFEVAFHGFAAWEDEIPGRGDYAVAWLMPEDAAMASRNAYRPSEVAAKVSGRQPGRDSRRGAAGRPAGRKIKPPGILSPPKESIGRLGVAGPGRDICLPENDCACCPQHGDGRSIMVGLRAAAFSESLAGLRIVRISFVIVWNIAQCRA